MYILLHQGLVKYDETLASSLRIYWKPTYGFYGIIGIQKKRLLLQTEHLALWSIQWISGYFLLGLNARSVKQGRDYEFVELYLHSPTLIYDFYIVMCMSEWGRGLDW
jgi:hypothetical protein